MSKEAKAIEQMSYEEAFSELEAVVAALESGERPLEEAMMLFERGQALARHCTELLDKAELKVQTLTGETLSDFKRSE